MLWPGQFVNVALTLDTVANATVVPSEAVQAGQQGPVCLRGEAGQHGGDPPGDRRAPSLGSKTVIEKGAGAGRNGGDRRPDGALPRRARCASWKPPSRAGAAMNLSQLFIERPIMTVLVCLSILLFGVVAFRALPVAALPSVDYPTITVSAALPGASPETMASTVATPLERQFSTIAGISQMSSVNSLGSTADHRAVQPEPQHRRRRAGYPGRHLRGRRPAAHHHAAPAHLPENQSGGPGRSTISR